MLLIVILRILLTACVLLVFCTANVPTVAAQTQDGGAPWHDVRDRLNPFPTQTFQPTNQTSAQPKNRTTTPTPKNPRLGTNFANYYKAPGVRAYGDMRDAGASHDRITFDWFRLQPTSTVFSTDVVQAYDALVADAGTANIQILGVLIGAPDWAKDTSITGGAYNIPRNLNLAWNDPNNYWGQYVNQIALRYKGTVRDWEVWNEPNLSEFWPASPALFARLMQVSYQAIKAADPNATVVLGGIYRGVNDTTIRSIFSALRDLDPTGVNRYFHDVIGFHLYDGGHCSTLDELEYLRQFFWKPYVGDKPIWMTESGIRVWDTPRNDGYALPIESATFFLTNYAYSLAHGVQRYYYFRAIDPDPNDPQPWGLLRADGTPRLSLTAMRVAAQYLPSQMLGYTFELVNNNAVHKATFFTPSGRTTVVWNISAGPQDVLLPSGAPTGTLVTQEGITNTLDAVSGTYVLNLAPAQNFRWGQPTCQVASPPLILIEDGVVMQPRQWLPVMAR